MRIICGALLMSVAVGCTPGFGFLGSDAQPPAATQAVKPEPPPEPVTADQVKPDNAHRVANALQEEMDRE